MWNSQKGRRLNVKNVSNSEYFYIIDCFLYLFWSPLSLSNKLQIQSIYHIRYHLLIIFTFANKNNPKSMHDKIESLHEALTSWINKVAQQAFTAEGKSLSSTKEKWQSECKCRIYCRVLLQSLFIKITAWSYNVRA